MRGLILAAGNRAQFGPEAPEPTIGHGDCPFINPIANVVEGAVTRSQITLGQTNCALCASMHVPSKHSAISKTTIAPRPLTIGRLGIDLGFGTTYRSIGLTLAAARQVEAALSE